VRLQPDQSGRRIATLAVHLSPRPRAARSGRLPALLVAVVCLLLGLLCVAGPAAAQTPDSPAQVIVSVVGPNGSTPRPTGNVIVSVDGISLLTLPVTQGLQPLTSITPQLIATFAALGLQVTIGYSGDNNYEASDGLVLTVPTPTLLTLVPRPKDTAPVTVDITSPADGANYTRGESVLANYRCADLDSRPLTTCDGPVRSGAAIDTSTEGTHRFAVSAADDLGSATTSTATYTVGPAAAGPSQPPPSVAGSPPPPAQPVTQPVPATPSAVVPVPATIPPVRAAHPRLAPPPAPSAPPGPALSAPVAKPQPSSQAYDPRSQPEKTFSILAAGLTLLTLATGGGGIARGGGVSRSAGSKGSERPRFSGLSSYQGVEVRNLSAGFGVIALGDRSRTWHWPATEKLDTLAATIPARVARRSPLLGRIFADSTYLRAMLGSASLLIPIAGLGLGIAAVQNTAGVATPPSVALTAAIAVLGVIDAASGLIAMVTFVVGVAALGGINTADHLRLMLGLGALWSVVPVLAGVTRPLRRAPAGGFTGVWERGADFIIVSLIGAWVVQRIVLALPGLAGMLLPIDAHANQIALIVLAALVVRLAFETLAAHLYPLRLDSTASDTFPTPPKPVLIGSGAGRTAIYAFLVYVLIGDCWQLYVSSALFFLTQLIWVFPERFPNFTWLYRAVPKGLTQLVVFLYGYTIAWLLMKQYLNPDPATFFPDVFVGYGLLGLVLPLPLLFGRSGQARQIGWGKRILGLGVLVIAVLQVRGYLLK
jgi:hypothetical protein